MKTLPFTITLAVALALPAILAVGQEKSAKLTAKDTAFIMEAADGGMAEVELGKVAAQNAQRDDVKQFGQQMVSDHGKANDNLKSVASKLQVPVSDKLSAKHQGLVDKMSKMTGPAFDNAYVPEMVSDHEKDIAEFEKARNQVTNEDLKKFIDETIPVMKEHLEMAKKLKQSK